MVWLLQHTAKFPRHERFRLAKRIDDALFGFHNAISDATKTSTPYSDLQVADRMLLRLRFYLRLSLEMRYTSDRQYHYAAEKVDEIGRLLGGWMKKVGPLERSNL